MRSWVLCGCLLAYLTLSEAFFWPSWSKKTDQGQGPRPYNGQPHHFGSGGATAHEYPLFHFAYPVAPPPPSQSQQYGAPLPPAPAPNLQAVQASYNMQLVPCLCSVPKDEPLPADDPNSAVIVQSSQQLGAK